MSKAISYQNFRIETLPSPETNDHEVRFFGYGDDIIARFWSDSMGLDPVDILKESSQLLPGTTAHKALIARCSCGVIGCGDVEVEIHRNGNRIHWVEIHGSGGAPMRTFVAGTGPESVATEIDDGDGPFQRYLDFPASHYEAEVERAVNDTGWETPERTAARLVRTAVNHDMLARNGLTFLWASGRARKGMFTLALNLEPGPYQILLPMSWNGTVPEEIAKRCAAILAESPVKWKHAEWWPQKPNLGPPPFAGPTWRRGG